jgi:putative FmdB family regulatory protein
MPIYSYKCQNCGHEVEEILSFSNSEKYLQTVCPKCFTKSYKKRINTTSFKLKGKGWYKDGYN